FHDSARGGRQGLRPQVPYRRSADCPRDTAVRRVAHAIRLQSLPRLLSTPDAMQAMAAGRPRGSGARPRIMTTSPSRGFDREYFDRNYRDYERQNPPRKLRFYRRLLERVLSREGRRSILEIGCGPGAFLASLDDRWHKYGFDVSPYAI